jgi:hypothetical protein
MALMEGAEEFSDNSEDGELTDSEEPRIVEPQGVIIIETALDFSFPRELNSFILEFLLCPDCRGFVVETGVFVACKKDDNGLTLCSEKCVERHMQSCADCLRHESEDIPIWESANFAARTTRSGRMY